MAPSPEKGQPSLSQQPPLKIEVLSSPPAETVEGSPSPPKEGGEGPAHYVYTMCMCALPCTCLHECISFV